MIFKLAALLLASIFFLGGSIHLFQKKRGNSKATVALGISLLCWATLPIMVGANILYSSIIKFIIIWNASAWIGIITAIYLATIHLLDFSQGSFEASKNHKPAWQTLIISFCFIVATGLFVFYQKNIF